MIGPMTQELIDQFLAEVTKDETQDKIKKSLLDPVLRYLSGRVFTYLQFLGLLMAIMIILLVTILYLILRKRI